MIRLPALGLCRACLATTVGWREQRKTSHIHAEQRMEVVLARPRAAVAAADVCTGRVQSDLTPKRVSGVRTFLEHCCSRPPTRVEAGGFSRNGCQERRAATMPYQVMLYRHSTGLADRLE